MNSLELKRKHTRRSNRNSSRKENRRCFLVYYEGGFSSLKALQAAIKAADSNTQVIAVTLQFSGAESQTEHSNAIWRADAALAAAETNAQTYGMKIKTEIIKGEQPSDALARFASECEVERIFVGADFAPHARRISELVSSASVTVVR